MIGANLRQYLIDQLTEAAFAYKEAVQFRSGSVLDIQVIDALYRAFGEAGLGYDRITHNWIPDTDETLVVIMDEAAPMLVDSVGFDVDQSGLHVMVRGKDSPAAFALLNAIYNVVVGFYGDMGGVNITQISPSQYPSFVETDDRQRSTYTAHFVARFTNPTRFRRDEPLPILFYNGQEITYNGENISYVN